MKRTVYKALLISLILMLCLSLFSCFGEQYPHSFGEWTIIEQPTCEMQGLFERTCSECGEKETQRMGALGHLYDDGVVVLPPTCTDIGQINYTCRLCGFVDRIKAEKTSHELTEDYLIFRTYHARQCTACLTYQKKEEHFFSAEENVCLECGYDPYRVDIFNYVLSEDESYYIILGLKDKSIHDVVIPDVIDELPVREINAKAFFECDGISSITIPATVKTIGKDAFFACDGLTSTRFLGSPEEWVVIEFENEYSNPTYITSNIYFG